MTWLKHNLSSEGKMANPNCYS